MKRTVTLSIDNEIYEKFQDYCRKNGYVVSRLVEMFMKQRIKK